MDQKTHRHPAPRHRLRSSLPPHVGVSFGPSFPLPLFLPSFPWSLAIDSEPQGGQNLSQPSPCAHPAPATPPGSSERPLPGSAPGQPLSCGLRHVGLGKPRETRRPRCYGNFCGPAAEPLTLARRGMRSCLSFCAADTLHEKPTKMKWI